MCAECLNRRLGGKCVIIVIIMNRHKLRLGRPVLASYTTVFGGLLIVFNHLVCNSALFWLPVAVHSCYMS